MTIKLGINGFGRIGRSTLRALSESGRKDVEVVKLNCTGPIESNVHLFKYDTVHGRFKGNVKFDSKSINIGRGKIEIQSSRDPKELDWSGIDVLLECTGKFNSKEASMAHIEQGAKSVLLSAPGKNADKTIVYGVNHNELTKDDIIVSNASCTTNCLAPVAYILDREFGIERGFMTTIHAYTGDQPTLDRMHKDLFRARAAAASMIPTTTGAARAVGIVLPQLKGKLDGSAVRVPTPNVSLVDLKAIIKTKTNVETINAAMKEASEGELKGILGYNDEPLVSVDYVHDSHSSIFAAEQTDLMNGNLVRIMSWYDNEWGFSYRMLDTAAHMGKLLN
jgi:glyceraldehyde 3-phosphate dehydrogenase